MKKVIIFLPLLVLLSVIQLYAQVTYPIRADTVKIYTGSTVPGAGGELLLQNASRTVLNGLLTNINNRGNTEFRNLVLTTSGNIPSGSILGITGQGTVALPWLKPYVDTMYLSSGNLLYQKNGNTYTVTLPVAPVYTASNYLTKTGNNFTLGGTGTANTLLNAGTFNFTLQGTDGNAGVSNFALTSGASANFVQSVTRGTTSSAINNFYNTVDITSATTGSGNSLIRATPVSTSMNLTTAGKTTSLSLSTGLNLINDGISAVGLTYADNYAENNLVNLRWLVDKGYVDSSIIAGAGSGYTAGNLLSLAGNVFELGTGNATHFTQLPLGLFGISMFGSDPTGTGSSLDVNASSSSNIQLRTVSTAAASTITVDEFGININNLNNSGANRSQVNMATNKAVLNYLIAIGTPGQATSELAMQAGGNLLTDQIAAKGIRYANNYAANNTGDDRWLTDKRYVDSNIVAHTGITYSASNMITLAGTSFQLGGTATQNTSLNLGANTLQIIENLGANGNSIYEMTDLGANPITSITNTKGNNVSKLQLEPTRSQISNNDNGSSLISSVTSSSGSVEMQVIDLVGGGDATYSITTTGSQFLDHASYTGLRYGDNYGENNLSNLRWIPDKNYVDSMVSFGVPPPNLQVVTDQGAAVTTPGINVALHSPSGSAGSQFNVTDFMGAAGMLQAFNDGTNSWAQLVIQADTAKIVTTHDLTISTDAGINYGIIHEDGTFTDGSGKVKHAVRSVTATGPALHTDYTILVNNAAAATITLPPAIQSAGQIMIIKKLSAGSLDVTIAGNAAELIDGVNTQVMTIQFSSVMIQCDGTGWQILCAFTGGTPL